MWLKAERKFYVMAIEQDTIRHLNCIRNSTAEKKG